MNIITRSRQLDASLDRSFWTIICRASNGDIYSAERILKCEDENEVVKDIADGQVEGVQAVLESNPVEGWSRNVSYAIAEKIMREQGVPECCKEFLEEHLGCWTIAEAEREFA